MSDTEQTLVVGLGSPHGDDQAGWIAVSRLTAKSLPGIKLVHLGVPHDLLDRLDGFLELHVIDARDCRDDPSANGCLRFKAELTGNQAELRWRLLNVDCQEDAPLNQLRPARLRSSGSHQLDILTVLDLANCLQRLPESVVLWTIPGFVFGPVANISLECDRKIDLCVAAIASELHLISPKRL